MIARMCQEFVYVVILNFRVKLAASHVNIGNKAILLLESSTEF